MRVFLVIALLLLSGCTTYKLYSLPDAGFDDAIRRSASHGTLEDRLTIERTTVLPSGSSAQVTEAAFCSEPLIPLLTLGIVPRNCSDKFSAVLSPADGDAEEKLVREYETRFIAGWIALLLLPQADWKYGDRLDLEQAVRQDITKNAKKDPAL